MSESSLVRAAKDVGAGTVGGIAVCLTGHPFDTLKVRLQTQPSGADAIYKGLSDCFLQTVRGEGIGGLYKGVGSPLVGQMFFRAIMFSSYGQSVALMQSQSRSPTLPSMPVPYFFCAGAMTGCISSFIEGPIDFFKSQVQVEVIRTRRTGEPARYRNVFHCAREIVGARGFTGAYQGLSATLVRNIPASASFFGFNEATRRFLAGDKPVSALGTPQLLIAGGTGGFLYWATTYPFDVIKSSMQSDAVHPAERRFRGWWHCARSLYEEGGARRFTRGLTPCLMRSVPANAVMWLVFEKTRAFLGRA